MARTMLRATVSLLVGLIVTARALAAAGDVDVSFGDGGYWAPGPECCGSARGVAVALQGDGKVVVAGYASDGELDQTVLVRFNADGSPDAGFGSAGVARFPVGSGHNAGRALALQPDGKIVVAGTYADLGGRLQPFVLRASTNGQLDATFGAGGVRTLPELVAGSPEAIVHSMALQADGKILVAGSVMLAAGERDMFAARLDPGGARDMGFGALGVARSTVASDDEGLDVALGSDGRIVVVGSVALGNSGYPAAMRLLASGALDTSFDGDGLAIPLLGFPGQAKSAAIQADGAILVAGQLNSMAGSFRLTPSGALDTSYNGNGIRTQPGSPSRVRILADGNHIVLSENGMEMILAGYLRKVRPDGTADPSWTNPSFGGHVQVSGIFHPRGADVVVNASGEIFVVVAMAGIEVPYVSRGIRVAKLTPNGVGGTFGSSSYATAYSGLLKPSGEFPAVAVASDKAAVARRAACGEGAQLECSEIVRLDVDGQPDAGFGTAGRRVLQNVSVTGLVRARSDGKVYYSHYHDCDPNPSNTTPCERLVRLSANGSDDGTFSPPTATPGAGEQAQALVLLSDGRFVFGGRRYLESGSLDPSFNLGGPIFDSFTRRAMVEGPALGLVAAGTSSNETSGVVSRRQENGALDLSFGSGGNAAFSAAAYRTGIDRVAVQSDGRIVVAGGAQPSSGSFSCYTARLSTNGSLDPAFGSGGVVAIPGVARCSVGGVALQSDGKVVIAGTEIMGADPNVRAFAVRLNPDGSLDSSFGASGIAFPDVGPGTERASALVVESDGGIVIAGSVAIGVAGRQYRSRHGVFRLLGAASPVSLGPATLPALGINVPAQIQLVAAGGASPYAFTLMSGTPPPGVSLVGALLQGTPTAAGSFVFVIRASDQGGASASRAYTLQVHDAATLVASYYRTILGRPPDEGGHAFWQSEVARVQELGAHAGDVFHAMSMVFFGSAEYRALAKSDTAYVTDLYRTFLQREPDPGGLEYWSQQSSHRASRARPCSTTSSSPTSSASSSAACSAPRCPGRKSRWSWTSIAGCSAGCPTPAVSPTGCSDSARPSAPTRSTRRRRRSRNSSRRAPSTRSGMPPARRRSAYASTSWICTTPS